MVDKKFRDAINAYWEENKDADIVLLENPSFDKSIVGITDDDRIIYDYTRMVMEFAEDNGCDLTDAIEFIDYNTIRSLPYIGKRQPVIMKMDKEDLLNM